MPKRFTWVPRDLSLRTMIAGLMVIAVLGAVGALAAGNYASESTSFDAYATGHARVSIRQSWMPLTDDDRRPNARTMGTPMDWSEQDTILAMRRFRRCQG